MVIDRAISKGINVFYSGGALGTDSWASEIVLSKKETNNDIKLIIVRPFPSQSVTWSDKKLISSYEKTIALADYVIDTGSDPGTPSKYLDRNRKLVELCDFLVAVWDGERQGGTYYTLNEAYKEKKPINLIDVRAFSDLSRSPNYWCFPGRNSLDN